MALKSLGSIMSDRGTDSCKQSKVEAPLIAAAAMRHAHTKQLK